MARRFGARRRYVVMPGEGVTSEAMQSAVAGMRTGIVRFATDNVGRYGHFAANTMVSAARSVSDELSEAVGGADLEVVSQRFPDGPAVVSMTHAGRLALEAANPDLRVLPITTYYLPGRKPQRAKARAAGAVPSGISAVDAAGAVFTADAKQYFLAGEVNGHQNGKGVTVGIIDTGIDSTHQALAPSVALLRCLIAGADPTSGRPVDWGAAWAEEAGHGTHVAGIIAAQPGHGGPAGVAPDAKVIGYRVFPDTGGAPKGAENPEIINSIRAAIDDGCDIVNLSIEGPKLREDGVRSAINDAWIRGVVCVAAAGNGFGLPVSYPAAQPHCVAVTAIGRDGAFQPVPAFTAHVSNQRSAVDPAIFLASFSNFGPQVQFTAPGHAIVSTFPNGGWWIMSGTSMAAPFVSGMLARFLSGNSNIMAMERNAKRSAAMVQMLIGRAKVLRLPQAAQEGYGLPA
ncbi:MAG: S8 family serine peptidase [Mesorhizobium sp.]|nr:S8 family serine peptidase [Mesorhizobium sp.]MCO5162219.1 S8 family serine peptidase [Mesorhizobium sp.]